MKTEAQKEWNRLYMREYRKARAAECYRKNREWALANPEKVREYHRRSRKKNPDTYKVSAEKYRAKHPGWRAFTCKTRRARRRGAGGSITQKEWLAILAVYDGQCLKCGVRTDMTMDHVIPLFCGGTHTADNIQPLCVSCNSSKHIKTEDYRPMWGLA